MNKYCDKHGQLQPCVECLSGYAAMGGSFVVKQATPPDELIKQLMDSRVPKTEREHAAAAEIDSLRQRLAAAEAKIPRWIPVTEQLPEDDIYVLCNIKDYCGNEYQALQSCFCGTFAVTPTHWMPLPEAPGAEHG